MPVRGQVSDFIEKRGSRLLPRGMCHSVTALFLSNTDRCVCRTCEVLILLGRCVSVRGPSDVAVAGVGS